MDKDQKYFVAVEITWGKEDGNGVQKVESRGGQNWGALTYEQSVALQGACIVPAVNLLLTEAVGLGMDIVEMSGIEIPQETKDKIKGKK
jgi:hypothetical protein